VSESNDHVISSLPPTPTSNHFVCNTLEDHITVAPVKPLNDGKSLNDGKQLHTFFTTLGKQLIQVLPDEEALVIEMDKLRHRIKHAGSEPPRQVTVEHLRLAKVIRKKIQQRCELAQFNIAKSESNSHPDAQVQRSKEQKLLKIGKAIMTHEFKAT